MAQSVKALLERSAPRPADRMEWVDARMLAWMRLVLAVSALLIIVIDPSAPGRLVELTYAALLSYCAYSAALVFISHRSDWPAPQPWQHWADIAFYAGLVSLNEDTSSNFFFFFFFAVLVASQTRGFREGMLVTGASFVLFVVAEAVSSPGGPALHINRTLTPAVYLLTLGFMIAYWGGYEMLLKRRLRLLQQLNNPWSPRFGVDHTIGVSLERLLEFFEASSCVLVLRRPAAPVSYLMYTAAPGKPGRSAIPSEITRGAAAELLRLPDTLGAGYCNPATAWRAQFRGYFAYDFDLRAPTKAFREECAALAHLLDAGAILTVPYAQRNGATGRLYLVSDERAFTQSDIMYLAQASSVIATVVESMSLMDELISNAAEQERLKISRDLHDTTIQPYIGLKLALDGLQREAGSESALARRISELAEMAATTIRDLRSYTSALKTQVQTPGAFLVAAVERQADRVQRFYGIAIEVKTSINARLTESLAAAAFQIVAEGLSNVLRHTAAKRAFVNILCDDARLRLQIGNEARVGAPGASGFMPRSINERTQALGGAVNVVQRPDGYTLVQVTIPM